MSEPDLDTKIFQIDWQMEPWGQRMATRVSNTLQRHNIHTLGQLLRTDRSDLPPGISIVGKAIIDAKLKAMGRELPDRNRVSR